MTQIKKKIVIKKYKTAKYPIFYTDGFNDEVIETKKKLAGRQAAGTQRDRQRQINKATEKEMKAYLYMWIWAKQYQLYPTNKVRKEMAEPRVTTGLNSQAK